MKQSDLKTITIHWDGKQFILMYTRNSLIEKFVEIADIDLKIPDEMKQHLKSNS